MNHKLLTQGLLAASIALAASAQAADVRINGFASIAAGKSFSQDTSTGTLNNGDKSTYRIDPTNVSNANSGYDDDVNFNPDSNYGIQFSSDLGNGLSVTAQLTGKGSNDYEAELEWAYASYELNDEWTVQGGRMRLPLYHYSDFLDVGYAYHWLRAPVDVYAEGISIYQGLALRYNTTLGNWDFSSSLHYGNGGNDDSDIGDLYLDDYFGLVINATYDWLQLRISQHRVEHYVDGLADIAPAAKAAQYGANTFLATDDDPADIIFTTAAAFAHFDQLFLGAEFTDLQMPDDEKLLVSANAPFQTEERQAYMLTAGYRMGSLTPHVTYTERVVTFGDSQQLGAANKELASSSIIVGLRWDFHPAAAIKFEYADRSDDSDDEVKTLLGNSNEVSNFAIGLDVIF
ncbi:MAG: hypothetical protein AseanaTS_04830 [Candidatus Pelagadaptatus aseana]|uniref:hypothetical protein n=1 Tax=Candidatus Pelagadaptatus aseana TaxID=3120508 RepID=UPI0039B1B298